jgi:hypothetical protein
MNALRRRKLGDDGLQDYPLDELSVDADLGTIWRAHLDPSLRFNI